MRRKQVISKMKTSLKCLHSGWLAVGMLMILFGATACTQVDIQTPAPRIVRIGGATSMRPVLEALATDFAANNPGLLIEIQGGGSTIGEAKVRDGRLRLGASTLIPDEIATPTVELADETPQTPAPADTLQRVPIGVDAVAIVVNAHNPILELTSQQLQGIYSGRILDWQELGGNQGAIVLVSREDGSGARVAFESRIMGDAPVSLTAIVMPTSSAVVDYVATNPMAIGYVSSAFISDAYADVKATAAGADEEATDKLKVHALAVDGVSPGDAAVSDNSYPVLQPLFLVTNGAPSGWAKDFIDYALSPAGQETVGDYHTPVR